MSFKLTILGCSSAIPTVDRNPTAQLLNVNERFFLIDCGEGTQVQLRKFQLSFQRINHIFISHLHGDHYFGLIGLISSMHLLGRNKDLHIYAHKELKDIVETPKENIDSYHTYYVYVIQTDKRDDLREHLGKAGISTNIHYPVPTHMTPAFSQYANNFLKRTERTCKRILSLPVYHSLTHSDQEYIIDTIKQWKK